MWNCGRERCPVVILPKFRLPRKFRDLLHAANLWHGTDGFTSPPKEGVLRIFSIYIYTYIYIINKYLFTIIGFSPDGSGYFTCKQNMKLVTNKYKSGGLHEKHVVATWNLGNHLSICF